MPDNDDDESLDIEFMPDVTDVEFKVAKTPAEFKGKAEELLSNAMDMLNAKIVNNMAESSDLKTAVEIGKLFRVGIETVEGAAKRAMEEAAQFEGVETDDLHDDGMRFQG